MARPRKHQPNTHLPLMTRGVIFTLRTLIAIGDGARTIFAFFISLPWTMSLIVTTLIQEVGQGIASYLTEKWKPRLRRGRGRPKAPRPSRIALFSEEAEKKYAQSVESLKRFLAAIKLPRLALPQILLPKPQLVFPKITVPKLQLPKITLPEVKLRPLILRFPAITVSSPPLAFFLGVATTLVFVLIPFYAWAWLKSLPNPNLLVHRDLEVTTKIFDRNNQLLYEIYAEQNRTPIPLSEIPQHIKEATIAIEDRNFYRHPGFSLSGIMRAMREIIIHRRIQGGSTITQQLIKSALLTPEVTLVRKLKEIILAFWAERLYTKDQILEMYLNQVPYGGTAWGIEAAAQTYFGKSVREVNLAQAAILAGLPAAPSEYSPFGSHPEKALARQKEVLRRMVEDGYITAEDMEKALAKKIQFAQPRIAIRAPHFVMYVKEILERRYGPRLVERGGLRVVTSLDINLQEKVEDIVKNQIDALAGLRVGNGAALITNPKTGEILTMVGSRDYFDLPREGNVNIVTSLQQPGSAIKAVTYAAALENGLTAATIIDDSPVAYRFAYSNETYTPVNYDGRFHGPTPLRYALANSYNVPAVKTLAKLGVATMIEKGRLMGITSWSDPSRYGLSLTLGGGEVTMLEMAKIYGTLANLGKRVEPLPILSVTDYTGRVIERNKPKPGMEAVKEGVAWILNHILSDNFARSAAFGINSQLVIPGKTVAVKTGTSNDKRDNWTVGYTPSYVAAVWVGNNDNSPMHPTLTSGVTGAAPIWHNIMVELLRDKPDETWPKPETVVALPCYFGRLEYFLRGTEPAAGRCSPLPSPSPSPTPQP